MTISSRANSKVSAFSKAFLGGLSVKEYRAKQESDRFIGKLKAEAEIQFRFSVGIDLGQAKDSTVIACIEERRHKSGEVENVIIAIDALPLHMSYTDQARAIVAWHQSKEPFQLWGVSTLIDNSSLGAPCGDILAELGFRFRRANITSGDSISQHDGKLHVSRSRLISGLIAFVGREGTYINSDSPGAERFRKELESLEIESSKTGKAYVSSVHDDTVAACGLAVVGLKHQGRTGIRPFF